MGQEHDKKLDGDKLSCQSEQRDDRALAEAQHEGETAVQAAQEKDGADVLSKRVAQLAGDAAKAEHKTESEKNETSRH